MATSSSDDLDHPSNAHHYVKNLEKRLSVQSDRLEEIHMEAAIDAQLSSTTTDADLMGDCTNPHAVSNCWSPYMPTQGDRIAAFVSFVELTENDVLLDIGCGDGRVCVAAATLTNCRAIGLDVSPLCIEMAQQVAMQENVSKLCTFYQTDATIDPDRLLGDDLSPLLSKDLLQATVIFLYTYPTLLDRLVPLLARLCAIGSVRTIVTLTYHLPEAMATVRTRNEEHDFQLYSSVIDPGTPTT